MQGHLWRRKVTVEVATECAHCGELLHLELDSEGRYEVRETGAEPLVFHPDLDWSTFSKPTIIHDY